MSPAECWYALYVKPNHEKAVSLYLRGKGYEEFLPLYRRKTLSRASELPLFPGYVFCRFDARHSLPVLSIPGVFYVVTNGAVAAPIPHSEIAQLMQVQTSGTRTEPWPRVEAGQPIRVSSGPLSGVTGTVLRRQDTHRLIVSVTLLGRSVAVDVDPRWLSHV